MATPAIQQTLLPRATIDAFCVDPVTRKAIQQTSNDWRMARVGVNLHQGGLPAAISHFSSNPSPELVAVELDSAANDVEGAIDRLASCCQPGTGAIVLGHTNDVRLYRRLTDMGVSDYLVGPYRPEELIASFGKGLANVVGAGGKLVVVVGAKGGVGATTIAQSLAWLAGETRQSSSFLIDLQGINGTSGMAFGCEARRSLDELLEAIGNGRFDAEMLSKVAQPVSDHIQMLPGGRGVNSPDAYDIEAVEQLIAEARTLADVTIVDLPAGWHPLTRHVAAMADHVVIVTAPLLGALRNARVLMDDLRQRRGGDAPCSVVVNSLGAFDRAELPQDAIKDALEQKTLHSVPFMPNLFALAETNGRFFGLDKQAQKAFRDLQPLIGEIYTRTAHGSGQAEASSLALPFLKNGNSGIGGLMKMLGPSRKTA